MIVATLPGWGHADLQVATGRQVAAARWMAFSSALAPTVNRDLKGQYDDLVDADLKPTAYAAAKRSRRVHARLDVTKAMARQRDIRKLLLLDEPDEPPEADPDDTGIDW